ncbi:hypothetical protein [Moritella viscosa]|uniref:Uncharacterized protein n=1 Tax=Moritella viscosa TaxID=80854 RepID=A0ABY1HKF3_9GAMM|nr:hypothetical protein [Moritella viscosa]SGZ00131.1 Putative uncharacterized protein [Moritella viscosa]SGZ16762.1 Putative uncharacterized protein [Moritella viscosa]SHO28158.1 Putative uncharacterized protein [Moritella viscosa]
MAKSKNKAFNYWANPHEEALYNDLVKELGYKKRTTFFKDFLHGKPIILTSTDAGDYTNQEPKFKPNAVQIQQLDSYFISNYSVSDAEDIDLDSYRKIEDLVKLLKSMKATHHQLVDVCLKLLNKTLVKFDFEVGAPQIIPLPQDNELKKSIQTRLKNAKRRKGKRSQQKVNIGDLTYVDGQVNSHLMNQNQIDVSPIVQALLDSIVAIDTVQNDNGNSDYLNSKTEQLEKMVRSISKPKTFYFNHDFIFDKLKNINIYIYSHDPENLSVITQFTANMSELNASIKDCHLKFNNDKSTKNDKVKSIYELRKDLKSIALKQGEMISKHCS